MGVQRTDGHEALSFDSSITRWNLRFKDAEIEKEYNQDYFDRSLNSFRLAYIFVAILYAAFGLLDQYNTTEFLGHFYVIRYAIATPLLLLVVFLSFRQSFKKHWQFLISLGYIVGSAGICYMLAVNPVDNSYHGGLFLTFISGYFLIKLHFEWATISAAIIFVIYNLAPLLVGTFQQAGIEYYIIHNAFYISGNSIACLALHHSQRFERLGFFQRKLLKQKQEQIQRSNNELEAKVLERTAELKQKNSALRSEIHYRGIVEEELRAAAKKATESDQLKSAFLRNLSHEIRTPMNGIISFLELMRSSDPKKDEQEQFLDVLDKSGQRLIATMDSIIELSELQSSELEIDESQVEIPELLGDIADQVIDDVAAKNLELHLPQLGGEYVIKTDLNILEKVLLHLVKNAIKFTDEGEIRIGCEISDNVLQFTVSDTGEGIPEDKQSIIFERFMQADNSIVRKHQGAGLGLSICKAYVNNLKGDIWVESELGRGSTFYFTIEYSPATALHDLAQK